MNPGTRNRRPAFSPINPPPSVEIAEETLERVENDMSRIRADLESKTERDLGTCDRYDDWKTRATRALRILDKEKKFLRVWIDRTLTPQRTFSPDFPPPSEEDLAKAAKVRSMVEDFFEKAPAYHSRSWNIADQPSFEEVKERKSELLILKNEYAAFLGEVRREALRLDLEGHLCAVERQPIRRIITDIERELCILNAVRKELSAQQRKLAVMGNAPSITPAISSSTNPLTHVLGFQMRDIKNELQMSVGDMCLFLHSLMKKNAGQLTISKEESKKVDKIEKYLNLWVQCRSPLQPRE